MGKWWVSDTKSNARNVFAAEREIGNTIAVVEVK